MSIKFSCPHCSKTLKVKDELAGKKGKCPDCRKVVLIPVQTVMTPSRSGSSVMDLETLAAETLSEKKPEPVAGASTIEHVCPWCDEKVSFATDMGGKQAPCPSCKRIVKVPLPQKTGPRDWRKPEQDVLPSGAKRTDVAPEGAWGTEAARGVSREALVEADVIKEEREPMTVRGWIILSALALLVLGGGGWGLASYFSWSKSKAEANVVDAANTYLKENKGTPALRAVLRTGLGLHLERTKPDPKDQSGVQQLQQARLLLGQIAQPVERFGVGRELLRHMVDLDMSGEELGQVLAVLPSGLEREDLVREMCKRALSTGTGEALTPRADKLRQAILNGVAVTRAETPQAAKQPVHEAEANEQSICLAILAQELVRAGRGDLAQVIADPLRAQHKPTKVFPVELQALQVMLQKPDLEAGKDQGSDLLAGRALGFARAGHLARATDALQAEQFQRREEIRARTLIGVAEALIEKDQKGQAEPLIKEAVTILEPMGEGVIWLRWRIVELRVAAGNLDEAEGLADALPGGGAREWAKLQIYRTRLGTQTVEPTGFTTGTSAHAAALFALGRAKGRAEGSDALVWAQGVDEAVRPIASLGVALGMREAQ